MTVSTRPAGTAVEIPEKIDKVSFKAKTHLWEPQLKALCTRGFTPDRIISAALDCALKNPQIFDCDPKSIYLAMAKCARLSLDPGDGIDLVPLNNTVKQKVNGEWVETKVLMLEAWTGYKGLKALAIRQRLIRSMEEFCVYTGDEFTWALGLDAMLRHVPTSVAKRGELRGAYSIIRLPGGAKTFHYMPLEDIELIRKGSRSWGPKKYPAPIPWYCMKTVVRDYLSRQPQSGALAEAMADDDTAHVQTVDPETGEVLGAPAHNVVAADPPAPDDPSLDEILREDRRTVEREGGA